MCPHHFILKTVYYHLLSSSGQISFPCPLHAISQYKKFLLPKYVLNHKSFHYFTIIDPSHNIFILDYFSILLLQLYNSIVLAPNLNQVQAHLGNPNELLQILNCICKALLFSKKRLHLQASGKKLYIHFWSHQSVYYLDLFLMLQTIALPILKLSHNFYFI